MISGRHCNGIYYGMCSWNMRIQAGNRQRPQKESCNAMRLLPILHADGERAFPSKGERGKGKVSHFLGLGGHGTGIGCFGPEAPPPSFRLAGDVDGFGTGRIDGLVPFGIRISSFHCG